MEISASPSTRRYAARMGVDLAALSRETGRTTLTKHDIDARLAGGADAPAAPDAARYWDVDHAAYGAVEAVATTRFERMAAANLTAATQLIPQVTHHDRACIDRLEAFRKALKPDAAARGLKLTMLAFNVAALARCLRELPRFNASLSPDGETLYLKKFVHVGIAVDAPYGLVVPVIRDAGRKGVWRLAAEIADLAQRAQARKLRPDEMGGASMTISSLGAIGGRAFTPIVNPPEVAILGLTRASLEPVWTGEAFAPRLMLPLDLSYDHRVINGAEAARFTARHAALLEQPESLMI